MNSIELRDSAGVVHRQMVTPDVYARYQRGQYFNDLQPLPANSDQDIEPVLMPMRPTKPIASGHTPVGGQGLVATSQPTTRSVASSGGAKKTTVTAHPVSPVSRRVAAVVPAPKRQLSASTVVKNQQRISNPAPMTARTAQTSSMKPTARPITSPPVASTSLAHFSAEITMHGLRPISESAPMKKSVAPATVRRAAVAKQPTKKSAAKPAVSGKQIKPKSLLKPPTVETRTENDGVTGTADNSR